MSNTYFNFKQFSINQSHAAMKVGSDSVTLGAWVNVKKAKRILDIGTGTGLIAIMLAQRSQAQIDAVDCDENAIIDASENIKKCPWANRINLHHTNIKNFESEKYDCIVSNPPYFNGTFKSEDQNRNTARHNDNLDLSELFSIANKLLTDDGEFSIIYPIIDFEKAQNIALQNKLFLHKILKLKPTPTAEVKRFLASFGKKEIQIEQEIIVLEEQRHQYSEKYSQMVKDFYLKL